MNGIFSDEVCFLKSSVNPEVVLKGRPYGGVGFKCRMFSGIYINKSSVTLTRSM